MSPRGSMSLAVTPKWRVRHPERGDAATMLHPFLVIFTFYYHLMMVGGNSANKGRPHRTTRTSSSWRGMSSDSQGLEPMILAPRWPCGRTGNGWASMLRSVQLPGANVTPLRQWYATTRYTPLPLAVQDTACVAWVLALIPFRLPFRDDGLSLPYRPLPALTKGSRRNTKKSLPRLRMYVCTAQAERPCINTNDLTVWYIIGTT